MNEILQKSKTLDQHLLSFYQKSIIDGSLFIKKINHENGTRQPRSIRTYCRRRAERLLHRRLTLCARQRGNFQRHRQDQDRSELQSALLACVLHERLAPARPCLFPVEQPRQHTLLANHAPKWSRASHVARSLRVGHSRC